MPQLQNHSKLFWIVVAICCCCCWSSLSWSQEAKPAPADSSDPYFDIQNSSKAQPLKPMLGPTTADEGSTARLPDLPKKLTAVASPAKLPLSKAGLQAERESIEALTLPDTSPANAADVFEPGCVLAIVGGRPILVGDMLYEINELIEKHAQKAPENLKQTQRQQLVPRMLPKFVDRQLFYVDSIRGLPEGAKIDQINESLGTSFDEEVLPKFLAKSGATTSLQFDAQLRSMDSSLRQFRQTWIDDQFVKYFVSQKMKADDEVSATELRDYYDKHASEYQFPARARWEQLVIRFDKTPDRQAARRTISEMGNEVVYGAPLDAVAKKSSHDFNAKNGGQQDWITKGSLAAESLDKAIFEIPLNELSDIIETPTGFHIIRVLERTPAGMKPFRDAQVEIKEKLLQAKQEKRFEEYVTRLRREIPIEVVDQSVQLPEKYLLR